VSAPPVSRRLVVDLASLRAAWRIPKTSVLQIKNALDAAWDVMEVKAPAVSDGDGGSGSPEAISAARGAEIYLGFGVPSGVAAAAKGTLRWAHSATAGIGASLAHMSGSGVHLTNSAGVHAEPMADWVVAAIGYFTRGLDRMLAAQRQGRWAKEDFTDGAIPLREFRELRRLRGAARDVFATEPLPAGHAFWSHPRVLVAPHVSAVSGRFWERETALIVENIQSYLAGAPLTNLVDLEAGY